jgi:PAS domain S-box-containing protein
MGSFLRALLHKDDAKPVAISAALFFALTLLMAYTGVEKHGLSMVWPVSGVALAFIFRYGPSLLSSVFIGTFLGRLVILLLILGNDLLPSIGSSFGFALIYSLETAAGYYTLKYFKIERSFLETPKGTTFFVLTDFVMSLAATVLITILFWIMQIFITPDHLHGPLLFQILLSHFIGTLIFAPFVLNLFFGYNSHGISKRKIEFCTILLALGIISYMILFYFPEARSGLPLYLAIPVILWITLRFGQGPGIMAVMFMEIVFIISIAGKTVENTIDLQALDVLYFQGFVAVNAMIVLYLGSLEIQKNQTSATLKHNLKKLRNREQRLAMAIHGASLGTWEFHISSGKVYYNRFWAEMLGYSLTELEKDKTTWIQLLHQDEKTAVMEMVNKCLEGKIPELRFEHRLRKKNGDWLWVLSTGSIIERNKLGNPLIMTGIHLDIHKEKQARMELTNVQNRFRLFMDAHPGAVYIKDGRDFSLVYGNSFMAEFLGMKNIIGKTPNELFPQDIADEVITNDRETLRKGYLEITEERPRSDGQVRYFYTRKFLIDTEEGAPMLGGLSYDITEQKQAESELFESEARIRSIFSAAPVGIGVVVERVFTEVNQKLCDMTGYFREELIGKSSVCLYPSEEEFLRVGEKKYGEIKQYGTGSVETEFRKKDGTIISIILRSTPVDPDNPSLGVTFTAMDITERKTAEKALRDSETRFRLLFENAPIAMAIVGMDYRFIDVNHSFCSMLGYSREQSRELAIKDVTAPESLEDNLRNQAKLARGDIDNFEMHKTFITRAGDQVEGILSATAMKDDHGKTLFFLGQIVDITDLLKAQKDLEELNRTLENRVENRTAQLKALNSELESFSYSVSHDLRAPLRGIDGFSLAVLEDYGHLLPEEGQHYLDRVRKATLKMGKLIDDLLRLSRISRKELKHQTVSLSGLAREIMEELRAGEPERDVSFSLTGNMTVCGDKGLLRVVLQNLLGNAWKFTSGKDQAKIEFSRTSDGTFLVRDNGAGFDPGYAHKLFEVFQRLHTSRNFEGSGVGLATVRRIIHKHGGHVWAEGEPDNGATFYFTLKQKEEDAIS